jgi:hypothetical protein
VTPRAALGARPRHGADRGVLRPASGQARRLRAITDLSSWAPPLPAAAACATLEGVIPDEGEAGASPQRLTDDSVLAQRVLELVPAAPTPVWGRDELEAGEMWNSNSLVSWLLARSGVGLAKARFPVGGRAPGWGAGIVVAAREAASPKGGHAPPLAWMQL